MLVNRTTVAFAICGALFVGCEAPDQPTDLRKDGPPSVTAVTVMSDLRTGLDPDFPVTPFDLARVIESATYCKTGDEKRPALVGMPTLSTYQVCPDNLNSPSETNESAEGAPPNWFVRVVFDMLLDPSVEELIDQLDAQMRPTGIKLGTFVNTQPVTLRCNNVDVPYGGVPPAPLSYYVPNGNRLSWPLGPALYIQPISAVSVPTGATCTIALKDIVRNKRGDQVTGPTSFTFKIAPMRLRFSVPAAGVPAAVDGSRTQNVDTPIHFYWTAALPATLTAPATADIEIFEGADATVCGAGGTLVPADQISVRRNGAAAATSALIMDLSVTSDADHEWKPETFYRVQFKSTATVNANQGGPAGTLPAGYKLCFKTSAAS